MNIKGNYILTRAFLPNKKSNGTIIAFSSGFAFLPPSLPFLAKTSAYSISKMGTARFYEVLADEHKDLSVCILQPGIIRTALYEKGKLELDATLDSSKLREIPVATTSSHIYSQTSGTLLRLVGKPRGEASLWAFLVWKLGC
jgi:NAD(P)-dependent dehydrogenase (short-subunit alcohol dehydrogenase family)